MDAHTCLIKDCVCHSCKNCGGSGLTMFGDICPCGIKPTGTLPVNITNNRTRDDLDVAAAKLDLIYSLLCSKGEKDSDLTGATYVLAKVIDKLKSMSRDL